MDSLIGLYVPVHESSGDKTTNDTLVFKVYSNVLCLTRITRIEKCFHELHELKKSFHEYEYTNIRISQIVVYQPYIHSKVLVNGHVNRI